MATFKFKITQNANCFYRGTLEIEAKTEEAAIKKIKRMKESSLDDAVEGWELDTSDALAVGTIEVWQDGSCIRGESN